MLRHPLAITAASALLAGWLLPPFAHQWQDRQKERELKRELATQLDRDATKTVIGGRILVDLRFPEAQTTEARLLDLQAAAPTGRAAARAALTAARERERDAGATTYIETLSSWLITRSVTRSALTAYFPHAGLATAWETYANHVTVYLRLAAARGKSQRREIVADLSEYLLGNRNDAAWRQLVTPPRDVPAGRRESYAAADGSLSDRLLRKKNEIVRGVLAAHAEGFSTRRRDLLDEVLPFR